MKSMNPRREQILLSLKKLGYLSRNQLEEIHGLGSKRNTNRVLMDMKKYLSEFREGYDTVYYLSKEGREFIGCDKIRRKTAQVTHFLMRNQFYIFMDCPDDWQNELEVTDGKNKVIADACYKVNGKYHFLEVDNEQSMSNNKKKIMRYKKIYESGVFQNHPDFGYFPPLYFITISEYRQKKLLEYLKDLPHSNVFTNADIK